MRTWEDYKKHIRNTSPELSEDIDEVEAISELVAIMIEQRHELNLSQRDLAKLCNIPQSSVARLESGVTIPNLATVMNICKQLGLTIMVQRIAQSGKK